MTTKLDNSSTWPLKLSGIICFPEPQFYLSIQWCRPKWCSGKESVCRCRRLKRHRFNIWVGKIPWRRKWQLTPVFLTEECHGQRSLAGYKEALDGVTKSRTQPSTHEDQDAQAGLSSPIAQHLFRKMLSPPYFPNFWHSGKTQSQRTLAFAVANLATGWSSS